MAYGVLGSSRLRTWFSRHGHITLQQFTSEPPFILIMVIIRVVSVLLSPVFSLSESSLLCLSPIWFWFSVFVYGS